MSKSVAAVLLGIAALAFAAVAASAESRDVKVKATVTLKYAPAPNEYDFASFTGKVKAKQGCEENRKVKVSVRGGRKVGTATTDDRGRYEVTAGSEALPGKYVAKVKTTTLQKGKAEIVCSARQSKSVRVR